MITPIRLWPVIDAITAVEPASPLDLEERLLLLLDDLDPLALESADDRRRWRVYFADETARDQATLALRSSLGALCHVQESVVEDEGWALKVQQDLRAVRLGRVVVAPPWDVPQQASGFGLQVSGIGLQATGDTAARERGADGHSATSDDIVIIIEPSMGFGTGHHQSTRLCLEALQVLPLRGLRVIDIGTGSGVLALAACRLDAGEVLAIDNDADSVSAARENAVRNGLADSVDVRLADIESLDTGAFDIVIANLTAWLLRRYRQAILQLVRPGGRLVVSGFTEDQVTLVLDSFRDLTVEDTRSEDDWRALTLRRNT